MKNKLLTIAFMVMLCGTFVINLFVKDMEVDKFPRPECLEEMLSYAEILSKPFPFVRVDFYEVDGHVYFGELTFTPTGCLGTYYTEKADLELGEILDVNWRG